MTEPGLASGLPRGLPVDPDVGTTEDDLRPPAPSAAPFPLEPRRGRWPRLPSRTLLAVFAGGVGGGLARYGITTLWPPPRLGFPWATFVVNTAGAFALGLLLVVLAELWAPRPYLRPLLGTGVLGAFTTFSSVVVGTDSLASHGHLRTAVVYLSSSLLAALGATSFGLLLGRAVAVHRHGGPHPTLTPRRP